MDKSREKHLAELYESGKTLQEIGDIFGISRERVRQLIARVGVTGADGGASKRARAKKNAKANESAMKFMERYGCHPDSVAGVTTGEKLKFRAQRRNAWVRGIEFKMSLLEWLSVWKASGHYERRGRGAYVMARKGDVGPYSVENVYICTASQNFKDSYVNKPYHTRNRTAPHRIAAKGYSQQGNRYGTRYKGKWVAWFDNAEDARKKYLELAGMIG